MGNLPKQRAGTWRQKGELPPSSQSHHSPYDPQARYGKKREHDWVGSKAHVKAHVTQTCDPDDPELPRRMMQVTTTVGGSASDEATLPAIPEQLAAPGRLPHIQLVDAGYVDADGLAMAHRRFQVDVVGPTRGNFRWHARNRQGFDGHQFPIDWEARQAIGPQGHASVQWQTSADRRPGREHDRITLHFARADCPPCPCRRSCTRAASRPLTLHPHDEELALRAARQREQTPECATAYAPRAGVEATYAPALRLCGLRRSRSCGQAKTQLQHLLTVTALNLLRLGSWLSGTPLAPTRPSAFTRFMTQAA